MLYLSEGKVGQYLFGRKNPRAVIDFPTNLTYLVKNLSPNNDYDEDFFIDNHSLLPYYTPFLSYEQVQFAKECMKDGNDYGLHTIVGNANSYSNNIDALYYCPLCANENRHQYGEAYWHRVHQPPDVEICPTHQVWLFKCELYSSHARTYISADDAIPKNSCSQAVDLDVDENKLFLYIAEQSLWLLQHPEISTSSGFLRQQYAIAFHNLGLASYRGRINSGKVLKRFRDTYDESILKKLECSLERDVNTNWLTSRLLRDDRHSYPTIRHLLTLHFLGMTVDEFISGDLQKHPFGLYSYPCLNLICDYYRQFVISDPRIEECDYDGVSGYFRCPFCGFEYLRHGPDFTYETWTFASKIISYGRVWEQELKVLIDADVSVNKIARALRAGKETIKKQIDKLNLDMPKSSKAKPEIYDPYTRGVDHEKLEYLKQVWLKKREDYPDMSLNDLKTSLQHEYYYIKVWDKEWLENNSPNRKRRGSIAHDWARLDAESVIKVEAAAKDLLMKNPPERVTVSGISKAMGLKEWYIMGRKEKLPETYKLARQYSETHEEFTIRKLWLARDFFLQGGEIPTRRQLLKKASVDRMKTEIEVQKVIEEIMKEFT
jgi:hypothetical protein